MYARSKALGSALLPGSIQEPGEQTYPSGVLTDRIPLGSATHDLELVIGSESIFSVQIYRGEEDNEVLSKVVLCVAPRYSKNRWEEMEFFLSD